ncbi:MBL fold metallo-hydrolase [Mucilaginibacter arboris]|uniref:MBL fold metallo-hydrolase n=1 Tax=Mucilaginibacter arboris TaxID=2682090 RepID=A0A7K1SVS4_9SPHI|nr:MBL fold metallo-hydrolase [Mucilaginibacter arboris]MVN21431.1 MBL fold metallo-hydrolase [Mucilaginibacter arboris]
MVIEQFEDKSLSHYAYAIVSKQEMVLIDPARNIKPYLDFAAKHQAKIIAVIETHPHADFVSGHLELHQKLGTTIYCSALTGATYPHQSFDEDDVLTFGNIKLKAINTPGHSPDSISILLEQNGKQHAVFTGDALFIGDCGRPDLRETVGNLTAQREELALQMYHSLRQKLMVLDDKTLVYPAHGAGTLCGKALSEANSSTIGQEKISNWALQEMPEAEFVKELIAGQPFVPKYFAAAVELNKKGAENLETALAKIKPGTEILSVKEASRLDQSIVLVDTRPDTKFKAGHLPNSINLMASGKFETWLGSIVAPGEAFYLAAEDEQALKQMINATAKIGYESNIKEAFVLKAGNIQLEKLNEDAFTNNKSAYTIIDVRNPGEVEENPVFETAIQIPLHELRERAGEISAEKPIVVHCAAGYRSAAGSSILESAFAGRAKVFDFGDGIAALL